MSDPSQKQRIAAAVARLTGTLELVENTDAIDLLAGFIDAGGAVRFSQLLEAGPATSKAEKGEGVDALESRVLGRLAEIEARLDDGFTHAFRPRYRLPTAARAWSTLGQFGLLSGGKPLDAAAFKKACRALWAPYNEFLETHLKRMRFAVRDLRAEVTQTLSRLGPAPAELAALDDAFVVATRGVIDDLYRRIGPGLEALFATRLRAILKETDALDVDTFSAGFGAGGWLGEILLDASALYHALLGREGRRLCDLVKSASALGSNAGAR